MPIPDTQELEDTVLDILKRARKNGQLSDLTPRMVREEMEKRFSLEEDALGTKKYKSFIKDAIRATLDKLEEDDDGDDDDDDEAQPKSAKKRKPSHKEVTKAKGPLPKEAEGTSRTDKRKRKSKAVECSEEMSESGAPPPKKPSARSKPPEGKLGQAAKPRKAPKKPESHKAYKSVATIETSDEEDAPEEQPALSRSPKKEPKSMKVSPLKHKQAPSSERSTKEKKEDSDTEMSTRDEAGPSNSNDQPKPKSPAKSPKSPSKRKTDMLPKDPMEAELSSVFDDPPKKRRKKQEKDSVKPQKAEKAKRVKKTKEAPSKAEETVNKLKSIVAACGVRKVWKKEFEGLDTPSQQIKRLHEILRDLGMPSRYSLEKAKTIKEQRELAQELKDVQEFEKATRRQDARVKRSPETGEPGEQSDSDVEVPAQKRTSARAIRTFLESQSEEE
ncbi:hypothetical protein PAXRUDRAFT_829858 [Paxillus rubicundulus Ve08.2h10]|uniref:DEK-C domain-containing protein n=1 Tax=Paxillus rubicundulus Ve08.2h10 TaxID=930991 RepID=A0A0D0DZI0_9AGAM|nr:hypothetical protein PAXRUDRAFT_829858 [Paxillus rubicundulus Ve08.2h10]